MVHKELDGLPVFPKGREPIHGVRTSDQSSATCDETLQSATLDFPVNRCPANTEGFAETFDGEGFVRRVGEQQLDELRLPVEQLGQLRF